MTENKGNRPTHRAYTVSDGKDDRANWLEIGAAWVHKDGKGFDVTLKALPVDGRVVLRLNDPKPESDD